VDIVATNNSWGGGGFSQALQDAITAHQQAGMLFVAAAGNNSSDNDAFAFFPATYPNSNIISVLATTHNDARASFSNFGATTVDIGAPGENISSHVRRRHRRTAEQADGDAARDWTRRSAQGREPRRGGRGRRG